VGPGFLVTLALLGAALYLPSFSVLPFDKEEARRAIPAREMLASGEWIVPTIWTRPYLAKPPLFYWLVAGASLPGGAVDETATRLPSIAATLATALAVAVLGARVGGRRTGRVAGLLYLVTLIVLEKGSLGELEAVFGLALFGCLALLWSAFERSAAFAVAPAACLAAALLTKGPPALVFYAAAVVGIARAGRGIRALRDVRAWIPLAVGGAIAAVWVVALLSRLEEVDVLGVWGGEVTRVRGLRVSAYLVERADYLATVLLGTFPVSFACLSALGTRVWRDVRREAFVRFAEVPILVATAFFFLTPGTRTRYVYPLVPLLCVVAARVVDRAWSETGEAAWRRVRRLGYGIAGLGWLAGVAALWLLFGSIGDVDSLGPIGYALVVAAVGGGAAAIASFRTGRRGTALALCFAILAALRLLQLVEVVPRIAAADTKFDTARQIEAAVPPGQPLGVTFWDHFNTLAYVRRELVWVDPGRVEAGDVVLVDLGQSTLGGHGLETLSAATLDGRRQVAVARVLPTGPSEGDDASSR
jgi:4-amino-4-deoxy-L-arabinose transferase-like glycosyltransferase